jgi:serine O-acetyltransferase
MTVAGQDQETLTVPVDRLDRAVMRAVALQGLPLAGTPIRWLLRLRGTDIPPRCLQGHDLVLPHGGAGIVVHYRTTIGSRVVIYQGVTIGRGDVWRPETGAPEGVVVEDDAVLCAGAKVLYADGILRVARGSIIGANAVLTRSTGEGEIWAGVPARRIGVRTPPRR